VSVREKELESSMQQRGETDYFLGTWRNIQGLFEIIKDEKEK
jgi:hypothetical protein